MPFFIGTDRGIQAGRFVAALLLIILPNLSMASNAVNAKAEPCSPAVVLSSEWQARSVSLSSLLDHLSERYQFSLSYPDDMNQQVIIEGETDLNSLLVELTRDMNTVIQYESGEHCDKGKVALLDILAAGEESGPIRVSTSSPEQQAWLDPIVIKDMDAYAFDVLTRARKAGLNRMTPEQRAEFTAAKKRVRKLRKDEIKLAQEKYRLQKKEARKKAKSQQQGQAAEPPPEPPPE